MFNTPFKPTIFWDWLDFGLVLKVYKQNNIGNYHFAIDIQIGWLNLWLQCWQEKLMLTNRYMVRCFSQCIIYGVTYLVRICSN
jgi:hypothetical protein